MKIDSPVPALGGALLPASELPQVLWKETRRWRTVMVLLFAVTAIIGLVGGFLWPKKYESSTTILVQESNIIKPLMEGRAVTTNIADRAAIAREVIFSRKIMGEILALGGWMADKPTPIQQERIIEGIKNRTSLINLRENLIRIEYTDSDAERAFVVTQHLAELFIQESLAAKERESREAYEFISSQVDDYRKKLTESEDKLKQYRRSNPDARPGSETDTNARITGLRAQIENARIDLLEQQSREHSITQELSGESAITVTTSREAQFRSRAAELQAELDKLLLTYTDQHPDVIRVRHQLQDLQEQASGASKLDQQRKALAGPGVLDPAVHINPVHTELRSRLAEIKRNAAAAQSRMTVSESLLQQELDRSSRIAETATVLSELTRDYEVNRDIYQDLLKRRENARVSMNIDADHRGLTFNIQEPAALPLRPLGFRFMHFGIAGIGLGIALPLALLFGLIRWDPRMRSANQLEQLTGLPVLASVPTYANIVDRRKARTRDAMLVFLLLLVVAAYALALVLKWATGL